MSLGTLQGEDDGECSQSRITSNDPFKRLTRTAAAPEVLVAVNDPAFCITSPDLRSVADCLMIVAWLKERIEASSHSISKVSAAVELPHLRLRSC